MRKIGQDMLTLQILGRKRVVHITALRILGKSRMRGEQNTGLYVDVIYRLGNLLRRRRVGQGLAVLVQIARRGHVLGGTPCQRIRAL